MVNYTPSNQLSLSLFKHPFETELDSNNRWVKLAELIPWDELASVYASKLRSNEGRKSVDIRHVLGAIIVKHKLNLDDRGTIQMIQENIYLQYFCGLKEFTIKPLFDASLFVDIRRRLGGREFDKFNQLVISKSEEIKPHQARIKKTKKDDNEPPKNKGKLKVDATVADQEIKFPTDVDLLNTSREILEKLIDKMYDESIDKSKPRTYRRIARKKFLNVSKKKKKSKSIIRKAIKVQLQYVKRDLKYIDDYISKNRSDRLSNREKELLQTIREIYKQQLWMRENKKSHPNRIVSVHQPHVRPIVRGKAKANTEFGAKINLSEVEGFSRIDRLNWDAYNESEDIELQVENYCRVYGCYPKVLLADRIYLTRENRKYLKGLNIKIYGKPLGRPKKQEKTSAQKYYNRKMEGQRNHVEGKFGQGKRAYGLNNIMARTKETSESWINTIIFVMNLQKIIKVAEKYGYFLYSIFISIYQIVNMLFYENINDENEKYLYMAC